MQNHDWIAILDFGSQYTQLIDRHVREQHVYSKIIRYDTPAAKLRQRRPTSIILSGGPQSVFASKAPSCDPQLFKNGDPHSWHLAWGNLFAIGFTLSQISWWNDAVVNLPIAYLAAQLLAV